MALRPEVLRKPPPLRPGNAIALIAPSGCPQPERLEQSIACLEQQGYGVRPGRHLRDQYQYLSGRDADRAADLMEAFADGEVRAIFCARGGYGTGRLLDRLDYDLVARSPKVLVGFSDTTALQLALYARSGLVSFTGSLATLDLAPEGDPFTRASLWRVLTRPVPLGSLEISDLEILRPGRARGPLLGGCLALLCSLLGTPYQPDLKGAILLLEDVGEYPYRLDRMLNHLRLAGVLSQINGLIFGQFKDCFTEEEMPHSLTLREMVADLTAGLEIPIVANFPYGHFPRRLVLPLGVEAVLDAERPEIRIIEPALAPS
jgi:muramoyltetrapeptide carboxypeptidase